MTASATRLDDERQKRTSVWLRTHETAQLNERAETVRRAVAALPEQLRVTLILSEYEEKSHTEIGEILRCSAKAVEVRIYQARNQLRVIPASLLEAA